MLKTFCATALLGFVVITPSYAQDAATKCDDATMAMVHDAMKKDTDPKMAKDVEMAGKEMDMAAASMKDNKMDECVTHINMAKKQMMMK